MIRSSPLMPLSLSLLSLLLLFGVCPCAGQDTVDLGGGIETRTDVQSFADLSQDISSIEQLIAQNQAEEALGIYRNGMHSETQPGFKRSLASLANDMASADPKTPSFLFHLYGQADRSLNLAFDTQKLEYINNVVAEVFVTDPSIAVEAVWILNMWMYSTHLLYNGVYECKERSKAEDASLFPIGMAGFDKFIALWIGSGQTPGQENGFSLYKWTQSMAGAFGTDSPEAPTNTRIKLLYAEAVSIMSTEGACTATNPNTSNRLWELAINIESEMSKPLFQGLIHAIRENQPDLVDIYAKALIPQMSKCRPSLYKKFHESLILGTFSNDQTFIQDILSLIPDLTFCFGYSCADLGTTRIGECETFNNRRPSLAGFIPLTQVGNVAGADLDVYQINILASLKSYTFAEMMYMNGANIAKYRENPNDPLSYVSLHDIATSSERSEAQPFFDIYVAYNNEKDYGDKVIRNALSGNSKWASAAQISAIVSSTASFQILFLEAVTKLKIAVRECRDADPDVGVNPTLNPIDEAAALLIGSMEGAKLGGSADLEDGKLIYNIANRHAFQFNTLNQFQYSDSVSTIEDLLFAARGELDALDCENLERSAEAIVKYSMVGIIQACIQLAVSNEDLSEFSTSADLAMGEGLAVSILPLIHNVDPALATSIETNMIRVPGEEPVPDGGVAVGKMLGKGFTKALLLHCHNLGSISRVNPCEGVVCPECTGGKTGSVSSAKQTKSMWWLSSTWSSSWTTTMGGGLILVFSLVL